MRYLLDADVVSELMKARPDSRVLAWVESVDEDALFLSVVTLAELRRGVEVLRDGRRRRRLEDWVAHVVPERFEGRILDVDLRTAAEWARLAAAARRKLDTDALIAASASVHDCALATRDAGFEAFGISVFNPWDIA